MFYMMLSNDPVEVCRSIDHARLHSRRMTEHGRLHEVLILLYSPDGSSILRGGNTLYPVLSR